MAIAIGFMDVCSTHEVMSRGFEAIIFFACGPEPNPSDPENPREKS
jgi:hypothetical protein